MSPRPLAVVRDVALIVAAAAGTGLAVSELADSLAYRRQARAWRAGRARTALAVPELLSEADEVLAAAGGEAGDLVARIDEVLTTAAKARAAA